ncbi:conserved hypothetical protein [Heliomicrobium modesticaldum Ice1]|uniref:DUF3793 family protein n=1 Tax=Heliobacterium modesticaldum (strain ATCC 51547 / Ice1) TaxID=498761 RepID=B0TD73_HELMI|nr:DUF3793 family protein [Heliomicrobium modesticaldum]ABZ84114.1 conserved hypothetical protein [Heliomicrobium modesticaldum Ice1]
MGSFFGLWKDSLAEKDIRQARFEKWLFVNLSRVLFAGKAGEFIRFQEPFFGKNIASTLKEARRLARDWGVEMFLLKRCEKCAWVLFYREPQVRATLKRFGRLRQYRNKRLPWPLDVQPFLFHLRERWCKGGQLPHEIGLALGYPLKDVLGFLGLSPLPKQHVCEWCIYGDVVPSLRLKERFDRANQLALDFVESNRLELIRDEVCRISA